MEPLMKTACVQAMQSLSTKHLPVSDPKSAADRIQSLRPPHRERVKDTSLRGEPVFVQLHGPAFGWPEPIPLHKC